MLEVRNHLIAREGRKHFQACNSFNMLSLSLSLSLSLPPNTYSSIHIFIHICMYINGLSSPAQPLSLLTIYTTGRVWFMAFPTSILTTTVLLTLLLLGSGVLLAESTNLTIVNNCKETIWPGIAPNNNVPDNTSNIGDGFTLKPGQSAVFSAPPGWNGRIWGRTGCDFDKNGNGTCQTGDCGGSIKCNSPGQPPASIAQFAFGQTDFYDVSLVEGFNLPIVVKPLSGKGNCSSAGCDSDLKTNCPKELIVNPKGMTTTTTTTIIACNSACNVYNTDEYCCRSAFSTALTCMPTNYSRIFKAACPAASSFPFDSEAMTTCSATDYIVSFCSSRNQTQCTYHDGKLSCNGSKGLSSSFKAWQILLLVLFPALINLRFVY